MRDEKGRVWMGMNEKAAKPNKFRKIKTEEVRKDLPKHIRKPTERHEYIEQQLMKKGDSYKQAHKIALKKEKKPVKGVRFVERKAK
jgi:hypothetical protein